LTALVANAVNIWPLNPSGRRRRWPYKMGDTGTYVGVLWVHTHPIHWDTIQRNDERRNGQTNRLQLYNEATN